MSRPLSDYDVERIARRVAELAAEPLASRVAEVLRTTLASHGSPSRGQEEECPDDEATSGGSSDPTNTDSDSESLSLRQEARGVIQRLAKRSPTTPTSA